MKVYTVKECAALMAGVFKKDYIFKNITVRGTISGFTTHFSGVSFFSLIDEEFRISCFIGRMRNTFLTRNIKNGMEVSVVGLLSYDKVGGRPVLYVDRLIAPAESPITVRVNQLEKELEEKGWFDPSKKKSLPAVPFHVGIITSGSGAVVHDIVKTGRSRNDAVRYSLYNSSVQGEGAAEEMALMVSAANCDEDRPDVLIVARGGGAEEDLKPFSELALLDAVHNSSIPVISAVGHETDSTLLDRVADVRASTPTQAAEIAIPEKRVLQERIYSLLNAMKYNATQMTDNERKLLQFSLRELEFLAYSRKIENERKNIFSLWLRLRPEADRMMLARYRETSELILQMYEAMDERMSHGNEKL